MTNIPYTTAASDFMKFVEFKEDEKSSLIDFAGTDFDQLKANLISYLRATYPLDYNSFSESDLGMMLIEIVAYMGAVMSMKADMLAHELFLRTSKNPNNVRKLLELIGVRLRGPSSAAAAASITADVALTSGSYTVPKEKRAFTTNSLVDGQATTYTLYTATNGSLDEPLSDASLSLEFTDSSGGNYWTNVVLVEGSFAVDDGTFADIDVLKEVRLQNFPVVDGSIQVYIDSDSTTSGAYTEVNSLLSTSSSSDKIFQVVYTDDFRATVQFGDGVTGRLPESGADYIITYRVGGGERGNNPEGTVNNSITSSEGVDLDVTNILPFTGGADAETLDHARKYGKLVFRQQDRLVSLDDYISFANTFKSTVGASGKATAVTRKAYSSANIIDVYLLEKASNLQLQKASISFKEEMLESMQDKKVITDDIVLVDGLVRTLDLDIELTLDERFRRNEGIIKSKVSNVITSYFNVDNREFGEIFYPDDVAREIFTTVPEVRVASVMNFKDRINLEFNEILQLNNFSIVFRYV